jgi:hypothetical protein
MRKGIPGALLVVEDDEGIFRVERARASLWAGRELHPVLGDLEELAVDEANRRVWALAEETPRHRVPVLVVANVVTFPP